MNYLVTALVEAQADVSPGVPVYWRVGQTRFVAPECIAYYQDRTDAFTVVDGPDVDNILFGTDSTISAVLVPARSACAYIDFNDAAEPEMTITIGVIVYTEADTAVPANGVFTNGSSAADSAASLIAAINGDTRTAVPFTAVADESGDGVWLFWDTPGAAGNVEITTTSAANCTVHEESYNGADAAIKRQISFSHTVAAQELLSGALEFPLPFTPSTVFVQAYTATGAPVYFTDLVTVDTTENEPVRLRIATDGITNIAATNVVNVTVTE